MEAQLDELRARELRDIQTIMSKRYGRRFIWKILEWAHIHETNFSSDPLVMAFREGERNIGLRLAADVMNLTPDEYLKMRREAKEDDNVRDQLNAGGTDVGFFDDND